MSRHSPVFVAHETK